MVVSGNMLASAHSVVGYLQLRHLLAHVFFFIINFLLSMSLSKINKLMSVVTMRRKHLMNSVFVIPGIY